MAGDETGEGEGDWYHCWSCGMPCNTETDEVDDGASKVHTTFSDYPVLALGEGARLIMMGNVHAFHVALVNVKVRLANADGSAKEVVHDYKIVDTKGCPNDGNLNWKGNH